MRELGSIPDTKQFVTYCDVDRIKVIGRFDAIVTIWDNFETICENWDRYRILNNV